MGIVTVYIRVPKLIKTRTAAALSSLVIGLSVLGTALTMPISVHAATCTPTGFIRDSINLTAAQIGGNVKGSLDATGCNIGIYINNTHPGSVNQATIFGANYFGIVVDGGAGNVKADVTNSTIHDIGEVPFNGTQHGNAVYYYGDTPGRVTGKVDNNKVSQYQKGGIIINGKNATVDVHDNTVTGLGLVNFIAQNSIQVSRGAHGNVHNNTISKNRYTGTNNASSGGVLIYGGCGDPITTNVSVDNNKLIDNDVGIFLFNADPTCSTAPTTQTNNSAHNNVITNNAVTNISGNGSPQGYQAGIDDVGNGDSIHNNTVSGPGYTPENDPNAFVQPIDVTSFPTIDPDLKNNHLLY